MPSYARSLITFNRIPVRCALSSIRHDFLILSLAWEANIFVLLIPEIWLSIYIKISYLLSTPVAHVVTTLNTATNPTFFITMV